MNGQGKAPRFTSYTLQALLDCDYPTLTIAEWISFVSIGRTLGYELARNDEIPGLIRLGHRLRISTAATIKLLEADAE